MPRLIVWIGRVLLGAIVIAVIAFFVFFVISIRTRIYLQTVPFRIHVTGEVVDSRGKPLSGVEVRAVPRLAHIPSYVPEQVKHHTTTTAVTDDRGRFRMSDLYGGIQQGDIGCYVQEYDIVADAKGYAPRILRTPLSTPSSWKRGQLLEDIRFALDEEAFISGLAVDTRGRPLARRDIQPVFQNEPHEGVRPKVPDPVISDTDGRFHFAKMSPGVYRFQVEGYPENRPRWGPFYSIPQTAQSKPVTLAAGRSMGPIEVVFEAPEDRGAIAGHVVDAVTRETISEFVVKIVGLELPGEGTPLLGRIRSEGRLEPISDYRTELKGKAGAFRIEDISPGTASLVLLAAGRATVRTKIRVRSGQTVETTFPLVREARIHGVNFYKGKPLPGSYASIRRLGKGMEHSDSAHLGGDGRYDFRGVPEGEYLVNAFAHIRGFRRVHRMIADHAHVFLKDGETIRQDFHFKVTSGIRGKFLYDDPDLYGRLRIEEQQSDPSAPGPVGYSYGFEIGHGWACSGYEIIGIPPGMYTVTGKALKFYPRGVQVKVGETTKTVTINPGQIGQVDFDFRQK